MAKPANSQKATMLSDTRPVSVSVIIPCYNEERNLERGVLEQVYQYLQSQPFAWEVVVVNDESTDRSWELLEELARTLPNLRLFDIPHGGKPAALWAGVLQARSDVLLFTDMDQSTPIQELGTLLPWYQQGYEVVIGSRSMGREGTSLLRHIGSLVFLSLRRLVLLPSITDTQCGFKLCQRQVAVRIFPNLEFFKRKAKPTGWKVTAYDVEFLYLVEKLGYRIKEVPVYWANCDESTTKGTSSDFSRYIHESIDMAKEVLRIKLNQLKGLYDKAQS